MKIFYPENKDEWLKLRSEDLTSTEVPALFGLSPYSTEFELWHRKKNDFIGEFEVNERMKWGNRLEPVVAEGIAEDQGWSIRPMKEYIRIESDKIGSSFDYAIGDDGILEIKNVDGLAFKKGWIIEGGEVIEAPPHIEIQVQHQLLVSGRKYAYIGAFVGGNSVAIIKREPSDKIQRNILYKAAKFWESIRENKQPIINFERDADFIKELYSHAEPGKIIDGTDRLKELASEYKKASDEASQANKKRDAIKAEILTIIDAAEKVIGDGYTISAGIVGESKVEFTRKAYRNFRVFNKKDKEE